MIRKCQPQTRKNYQGKLYCGDRLHLWRPAWLPDASFHAHSQRYTLLKSG